MGDPRIVLGVGIGAAIAGFLLRWVLPPAKAVASQDLADAEAELQQALANEKKALATPDPQDDVAAHNAVKAGRAVAAAKRRIVAVLDALGSVQK